MHRPFLNQRLKISQRIMPTYIMAENVCIVGGLTNSILYGCFRHGWEYSPQYMTRREGIRVVYVIKVNVSTMVSMEAMVKLGSKGKVRVGYRGIINKEGWRHDCGDVMQFDASTLLIDMPHNQQETK